jgi:hypothetical protein
MIEITSLFPHTAGSTCNYDVGIMVVTSHNCGQRTCCRAHIQELRAAVSLASHAVHALRTVHNEVACSGGEGWLISGMMSRYMRPAACATVLHC